MEDPSAGRPSATSFLVDTKGICFFCLKDTGPLTKTSSVKRIVSLRNVIRFLKMDSEKIFEIASPPPGFDLTFMEPRNICVASCEKCLKLAQKFSKLYQDLELIQLKILGCISSLHETMLGANLDNKLVQKTRRRILANDLNDAANIFNANLMGTLRKETIIKCASKINDSGPRVQVDSVKGNVGMGINTTTVRNEKYQPETEPVTRRSLRTRITTPISKKPEPVTVAKESASTLKQKDPSRTGMCRYCRTICPARKREHIAIHHPDTFFKPLKLPSLSQYQFKRVVTDLLFKDTIPALPPLKGEIVYYKCPICRRRAEVQSDNILHMIDNHKEDLDKKLKDLQDDPHLDNTLHEANPDGKQCARCESYLPTKKMWEAHPELCMNPPDPEESNSEEGSTTPKIVMVEINSSEISSGKFVCRECEASFDNQPHFVAHKLNHLQKTKAGVNESPLPTRFTLENEIVPENDIDPVPSDTATPKSIRNLNITIMKRVASSSPTPSPERKKNRRSKTEAPSSSIPVIDISEKSVASASVLKGNKGQSKSERPSTTSQPLAVFKCSICGKDFPDVKTLRSHKVTHTKEEVALLSFPCEYCDEVSKFYFFHRAHLLKCHSFKMFKPDLPEGTTEEELQAGLERVLKRYNESKDEDNYCCVVCKRNYSKATELENHVLVTHSDNVVDRLKQYMKQKERVGNSNGDVVTIDDDEDDDNDDGVQVID